MNDNFCFDDFYKKGEMMESATLIGIIASVIIGVNIILAFVANYLFYGKQEGRLLKQELQSHKEIMTKEQNYMRDDIKDIKNILGKFVDALPRIEEQLKSHMDDELKLETAIAKNQEQISELIRYLIKEKEGK